MKARVKLAESSPVLLTDQAAWQLKSDLMRSIWRAPPSIRIPQDLADCMLDFPLEASSLRDIQRAWTAAVRRRYGRQVYSLGLKIAPRNANLLHMSQVKAFRAVLEARLAENQALAPLLAQDRGMWSNLPNWRVVKNRMMAQGLCQQTWRWLTRQKPAYVARIDWGQLGQLSWVNFHAALARPLPISWVDRQTAALLGFGGLTTWLRRNHEQLSSGPALNILRGVRLALERRENAETLENRAELAREEFPLITDWLLGSATSTVKRPVMISRHWTYDTLMARQAHWHLVELEMDSSRPNVFWPEVLGMGSLPDNAEYIELNSLNALLSEAKKMHHCVPSYIDRCMAGDVCIFHLQIKGPVPQRATLEIRRSGIQGWQVSQLKGPCNAPVSSQLWKAAFLLVSRLG
ncbi:MAG TPA: PcfJ domain-containing protein [Limnobacter sp.]|nr:PcfJ domain-containing protein [Limnobacter sp.]